MSACGSLSSVVEGARIPSIVHQSWTKVEGIPSVLAGQAAQWRARLPHWEYRLWTDHMNRALWQQHYPELLGMYDNYTHAIERADASRLLYMHLFGGLYADLDVAPCGDIQGAFGSPQPSLVLVRDPWRGTLQRKRKQHISNFFFASVKGHPFWHFAISLLASRQRHPRGVMYSTGPYFIDTAFRRFSREHRACTPEHTVRADILTYDEWQQDRRFGAHHWASTWHYNLVVQDDGVLDWLGIDETKNCREAQLERIFAYPNGTTRLRRAKFNTYPTRDPRTNESRRRYAVFLEGEDGNAMVKLAKQWEALMRKMQSAEIATSDRIAPRRAAGGAGRRPRRTRTRKVPKASNR